MSNLKLAFIWIVLGSSLNPDQGQGKAAAQYQLNENGQRFSSAFYINEGCLDLIQVKYTTFILVFLDVTEKIPDSTGEPNITACLIRLMSRWASTERRVDEQAIAHKD